MFLAKNLQFQLVNVKVEESHLIYFYDMPSFLLLLVISLTVVSHQAKDKSGPGKVAAESTETKTQKVQSIEPKRIALSSAATAPTDTAPPAIATIEAQCKGLLMPSETDAPILVKYWPSEKIELLPGDVAALAEQQIAAPVATQTVAEFFKNAATIENWMSDDDKTTAQRFQNLTETLQTQLENPQVYLFGERERAVVIIGKVKGGFGGIVTLVVET